MRAPFLPAATGPRGTFALTDAAARSVLVARLSADIAGALRSLQGH